MPNKFVSLPVSVLLTFYSLPGGQKCSQRLSYRIYEVLWLVAFSCSHSGYIVWRVSVDNPLVIQIPGTLYDVFLFLCNLSISGIALKNRVKLDNLLHAKKFLAKVTQWRRNSVIAAFILIAAYVMIFLRIVAVEYSLRNVSTLGVLVMFVSVWPFQRLEMLLAGICWIAWELLQSHRHFNKKPQKIQHFDSLRPHIQIYIQLRQAVSDFNDLFGYPIMLAVFTIMCFVLGMQSQIIFGRTYYYQTMELSDIIVRLFYVFPHLSYLVTLSIIGQKLRREGKRTIDICYNYSQKTEENFMIGRVSNIQKDFLALANQAFQCNITLSAAGFFSLDSSMILFIVNNFCTYLVALCQFMPGNTKYRRRV